MGCNSTFRARWDIFILFAVLYEMWVVPFAYSCATIDDSSAVQILDIISGSLFVADLILNFFTTYYQGEVEVFDHKKIAKKYVERGRCCCCYCCCSSSYYVRLLLPPPPLLLLPLLLRPPCY